MKVVLDTNMLVSGMLFTAPPHEILRAWSERRVQIAVSPDIEDEYRGVTVMTPRALVDRISVAEPPGGDVPRWARV